ncbi:MAG: gluconate 5-dehydrogenase [Granulosicoccus sp.]|jgi:gluconate 5-dehydrogenase
MMKNLFNVKDSVVLVSGGSRGIGLAMAEAFAEQGATVIITGRQAQTLIDACKGANQPMSYQVCDVADTDAINTCVADVIAKHGRIDTLINCAGINIRKPVTDFSPDEYDQILNINLRGAFFMAQTVGKQMIKQGSGSQINIDSLSTYGSLAQVAPYGMSKSGLSSMTRLMALEWGKHGVRVNGLAPGFILTDLTRKLWSDPNLQAWNRSVTPMQRMGDVDDLVGTAIFLASPAASYLTGQIIRVDGGTSAGINWPISGDFQVTTNDE